MKILVNIYHDINTEARTQDLVKIMCRIGTTEFLSYSNNSIISEASSKVICRGERNYFKFVIESFRYIKKCKPDVLVLHDYYSAIILGLIQKFYGKNKPFIIYDSSEIYYDKKGKTLKGKIAQKMQYFENKYIGCADLIIAANEERAVLMQALFSLPNKPFVLDNIHKIEDEYDRNECDAKYSECFKEKEFIVFYAGGISKERRTFELAEAIADLDEDVRLIIVGAARNETITEFNSFLDKLKVKDRVSYLGFISRREMKYLLQRSCISVSMFEQNCLNNTFCASGKVYESLFEGIPILTSTNPPLKNLCNVYGVGVSTDDLKIGIQELRSNYNVYKRNTINYINNLDYDNRIENYADKIRKLIIRG